jgi:hypothetical protein
MAFSKEDYQKGLVRLIEYNKKGERIKEQEFSSIVRAVQFGYASKNDFLVCEPKGAEPKHYWSGYNSDKTRDDYWDWPGRARQKDLVRFSQI